MKKLNKLLTHLLRKKNFNLIIKLQKKSLNIN